MKRKRFFQGLVFKRLHGIMEYWNNGMVNHSDHDIFQCEAIFIPNIPKFHLSIIPIVSETK
jgi:hypothetical protein